VRLPETIGVEETLALQTRLEAMGCTVRWLHLPGEARGVLQGTGPSSRALQEATKDLFDPGKVLPQPSWRAEAPR
jgi:hypothetical protein